MFLNPRTRTDSGATARTASIESCNLIAAAIALALVAGFGCNPLPALPAYRIVGADDTDILLFPRAADRDIVTDQFGFPLTRLSVLGVNPESGSATTLLDGLPTISRNVAANGQWIVWADYENDDVRVFDRATQGIRSFFHAEVLPGNRLLILAISDQALLVRRPSGEGSALADAWECVVLDLLTEEQTVIPGVMGVFNSATIEGDWVALMNDAETTVEVLGLELSTNIDLINWRTGARQTIAPNRRVSGGGPRLFLVGGRVAWEEFEDGEFSTRVSGYDIDLEQSLVLIEDFSDSATRRELADVAGDRIMSVRVDSTFPEGSTTHVEMWSIADQQFDVIASYESSFSAGGIGLFSYAEITEPRLIGNLAAWVIPKTNNIAVLDLGTATLRSWTID